MFTIKSKMYRHSSPWNIKFADTFFMHTKVFLLPVLQPKQLNINTYIFVRLNLVILTWIKIIMKRNILPNPYPFSPHSDGYILSTAFFHLFVFLSLSLFLSSLKTTTTTTTHTHTKQQQNNNKTNNKNKKLNGYYFLIALLQLHWQLLVATFILD